MQSFTMAMAEDDDDSDSDCLFIDENPTEPDEQGSTPNTNSQSASSNSIYTQPTDLPESPIDYLSLMKNVKVLENIPHLLQGYSKDQTVESQRIKSITSKEFSREAFDTNAIIESPALYHYLTTNNANPEKVYAAQSRHNNLYNLNLKQLLDAPARPPPNSCIPTANCERGASTHSRPQDPGAPYRKDIPNRNQMQLYVQSASVQVNQTSVFVAYPEIHAGGTTTQRSTDPPNDVATSMSINGYPQNDLPAQRNLDPRQSYPQHTELQIQSRQNNATYQESMRNTSELERHCTRSKTGPIPNFSVSEVLGRGQGRTSKSVENSQLPVKRGRGRPRKTAANPQPPGWTARPNMSLNSHEQPINLDLNPLPTKRTGAFMDMPSLSPQPMDPALTNGTGEPMAMMTSKPQCQPINPQANQHPIGKAGHISMPPHHGTMRPGVNYNLNSSIGDMVSVQPMHSTIKPNLHNMSGEQSYPNPQQQSMNQIFNNLNDQQHLLNVSYQHQSTNLSMIHQNHSSPTSNFRERETMDMHHVPHQAMATALNPNANEHPTGKAGYMSMPPHHGSMRPGVNYNRNSPIGDMVSLQPMHSTIKPNLHNMSGEQLHSSPQQQSMNHLNGQQHLLNVSYQQQSTNLSMIRQNHSLPTSNFREREIMDMLHVPHQAMATAPNSQHSDRLGGPLNTHPNFQPHTMNPFNSQHMSRMPPCYYCAIGACDKSFPSCTDASMPNPQIDFNSHIRNVFMPQNPGYSDEENRKAAYLASLRSQGNCDETRNILNNTPRQKSPNNVRNNLAGRQCNQPMTDAVFNPMHFSSHTRPFQVPNRFPGEVSGTPHKVTNKRITKAKKTTIGKNTPKKSQEMRDLVSKIWAQPVKINNTTEKPHVDLAIDTTQTPSSITTTIMQVPSNADSQKQIENKATDAVQTNISNAACTHDMNTNNQGPVGGEVQSKLLTSLEEASIRQQTSSNDTNKANEKQPWINIKSDSNEIPFIMDKQDMSMNNNAEATMKPCVVNVRTNIITVNIQSEGFIQKTHKDIDVETLIAILHEDADEQVNDSQTSKPVNQSTNTYETLSTSSVTTETMTNNESKNDNNICKPETFNSEPITNQKASANQIIEKSVTDSFNHQIGTNLNMLLPETKALLDILDTVKKTSKCTIINQTESSKTEIINDNINNEGEKYQAGKGVPSTKLEDKNIGKVNQNIIHVLSDSEDEDKDNLANWHTDSKDASDDCNTKAETTKIKATPNGNYTALHNIPTFNSGPDRQKEFSIPQGGIVNENNQNINGINEPQGATIETTDLSQPPIPESIFFEFHITLFNCVEKRLTENKFKELSDKVNDDILRLKELRKNKNACADMWYECHECHNATLYSPRLLYYHGRLEDPNDNNNCKVCVIFRKQYMILLIKYVFSKIYLNAEDNQITDNTSNVTAPNSINESQTHLKTALDFNDEDDTLNKQESGGQQSPIDDLPSSSKQTETIDHEDKINNTTRVTQNQTSDFVVKILRSRRIDSIIQEHIQCKSSKSNDCKSNGREIKTALHNNYDIASSNNCDEGTTKDTLTTETNITATHVNKTLNSSLADNKKKESANITNVKVVNTSSKCPESKSNNTKCASTIEHSDKNQERHSKTRKSSSEKASSPNPPEAKGTICVSNSSSKSIKTNDCNRKRIYDESSININPEPQQKHISTVCDDRDQSNQEKLPKKQKRINSKTKSATSLQSKNKRTSNDLSNNERNQEKHFKKMRVGAVTEIVTIVDAEKQHTSNALGNNNNKEKYKKRHKKRKSISFDTGSVPDTNLKPLNINTNNVDTHKSISRAETTTNVNLHGRHDNWNNKENNLGIQKDISGEVTAEVSHSDKDTASKTSNNLRDEKSVSNNANLLYITNTTSDDTCSNSKQRIILKISRIRSSEKDNEQVRKRADADASNKYKVQLDEQDNEANYIVRPVSIKTSRTAISSSHILNKNPAEKIHTKKRKKEKKLVRNAMGDKHENYKDEENDQVCIKVSRKKTEEAIKRSSVHCSDKAKSVKNNGVIEELSIKNDDVYKVNVTVKNVEKHVTSQTIYYVCQHCYLILKSLASFRKHMAGKHKKANILSNDFIKMRKRDNCTKKHKIL